VCRNGFSRDLAESFLADLRAAVGDLEEVGHGSGREAFHH
jgi:hypothetical protein